MGGQGSGKLSFDDGKLTVNDYHSIDIRDWHRRRLLFPGITSVSNPHHGTIGTTSILCTYTTNLITLSITIPYSDRLRCIEQLIPIQWTSCHLGGKRPWFICPIKKCKRKAAILYAGNIFACRKCYNLAYPSQCERPDERANRRAMKIRALLNWPADSLSDGDKKPKGMHRKTFERLRNKHTHLAERSLGGAAMRLKMDSLGRSKELPGLTTRRYK